MKLMLLNDEIYTAQMMKKELNWEKYEIDEVYLAYNVEQARKILTEQKIDIALCDIEMPEENGIDLLRWMRSENVDTECIFLTCHASFEYAQEAVKLGCQDYILMPARYEDIGASIYKVVLRRKQTKQKEQLMEYGKQWVNSKQEDAMENQGHKKSQAEVVEESVLYIREHLDTKELSVNDVSSHFYLNPIYLNRIFKKYKNISISQFIIKEKMELATRLLANKDLSVQVIADKVGYANYSYFSAAFKRYYGCSPTQYRE